MCSWSYSDLFVIAGLTFLFFFFFFQAEDGIRDGTVTGVQTCALPISSAGRVTEGTRAWPAALMVIGSSRISLVSVPVPRSEERRVGKECRSRWSPYH